MTSKKKKLYEGKAKVLYSTDNSYCVIQHFKDEATAFNAKKRRPLKAKGFKQLFIRVFYAKTKLH